MKRSAVLLTLLLALYLASRLGLSQAPSQAAATTPEDRPAPPSDPKAARLFAKAIREMETRKLSEALEDFRKADEQDSNHCASCRQFAFKIALRIDDFETARTEAAQMLSAASTPAEKAQAHYLAGDVCLAQGGYRIFEKPFQDADNEFAAALQLQPDKSQCLYEDGLALAHLHQYDKAKERFQQFTKLASPKDFQYARAELFASQPELARKRTAPDFQITALDGKPLSMNSLQGKVVLIDFWATWCGPCKLALPHLKQIVEKFKNQPLVVISVSLDQDEATWKYYILQNGMTWAQYRDGGFDGPIASRFSVKAIPTTFTIDANGFVQDQQVGDGNIEDKLQKLLDNVAPHESKTVAQTGTH